MRRDERIVRDAYKELESYVKVKGYKQKINIRLRIEREEKLLFSLEASNGDRANSKWYQVACAMPAGKMVEYISAWTDLFERIGHLDDNREDNTVCDTRWKKRTD